MELIPRQALGFYSLHEKVLTKELGSESQSVIVKHKLSTTKKGKMSWQVHECEGPMDVVCSKTIDREVNLFILYAITVVNHCTR